MKSSSDSSDDSLSKSSENISFASPVKKNQEAHENSFSDNDSSEDLSVEEMQKVSQNSFSENDSSEGLPDEEISEGNSNISSE